jgi:outer membrane protein assembly factor BamB
MSTDLGGSTSREQRVNEAIAAYLQIAESGATPDRAAWVAQHADVAAELEAFFADWDQFARAAGPAAPPAGSVVVPIADIATLDLIGVLADRMADAAPVQVFGDYELLEEIARGGMGVVYRARQVTLNRIVAIKMILAGRLASPEDVRRFYTEAQAAASLQHPNIVAIHEVGEQGGCHFFSMDYVEGKSLADLAREQPLPPVRAASYVKLIADAIDYAHQRGTLHRDLKPSNVLIDAADQPHVTDFGLARRTEADSELTGTGQVLGTPSYMPPEQAAGKRGEVGPPSDVYALGAILYDLLCGRPPFRGETPLATLAQVLAADPVAPRLLNERVPRDLETICLKCLQKDPRRRYATAASLANDLGLFLAGEPIQARRPGLAERVARWTRKQRRSVAVATVASVLAALLVAGGFAGWLAYRQWRQGQVSFTADEPLLVAEVLDENDGLAVPRFTVPTQDPLPMASGSYRVRLTGTGLLSESYQMYVDRGQRRDFHVPPLGRPLWKGEPIVVARSHVTARLDGRTDILLMSAHGLRRIHGGTAETLWETRLDPQAQPALARAAGFRWNWPQTTPQSDRGVLDNRPRLIEPASDVDGDGKPDLIWAFRHQATLLALSGKDGSVLWCFRPAGVGGEEETADGAVLGAPDRIDVDRDGVADLVATFIYLKRTPGQTGEPSRWIEAVSGRTGQSLWRHTLSKSGFMSRLTLAIPFAERWPRLNSSWSNSSGWGGASDSEDGIYETHSFSSGSASAFVHPPYPARVIESFSPGANSRASVVCVGGSRLLGFMAESGNPAWPPLDLGFSPVRAPVIADLDGDRNPDMLLLRDRTAPAQRGSGRQTLELVAVSLANRRTMWTAPVEANWDAFQWYDALPDWPAAADLDGDGRSEVIVTHRAPQEVANRHSPWGGLEVLDGATGHVRWHRRIQAKHQQVDRFLVGPDLDGDGTRDVFAATLVARNVDAANFWLYVDALSGRDGRTIWWTEQRLGDSYTYCNGVGIGQLAQWVSGPDGWPQLVIPYFPSLVPGQGVPRTFVISAGTGRLAATAVGVGDPQLVDFNGDGVLDFSSFRPAEPGRFDKGGKLVAVETPAADEWRRLDGHWSRAPDLSGDGVADLVRSDGSLTAISGRDGSIIWNAEAAGLSVESPPLPGGDLNGDGTPDILLLAHGRGSTVDFRGKQVLAAHDGRTGRVLWAADLRATVLAGWQHLGLHDLDGDGRAEVILIDARDATALSSNSWEWWVTVLGGRDGHVIWTHSMRPRWGGFAQLPAALQFPPALADLDGDRVRDVIVPATASDGTWELRALRGRDGRVLWRRPLHIVNPSAGELRPPLPAAADLDGDGRAEVVVITESPGTSTGAVVSALNGADGEPRWSWRTAGGSIAASRPPILADLDADGRYEVALVAAGSATSPVPQLVVLNAMGREIARVPGSPGSLAERASIEAHDVDGDGIVELLWNDGKTVRAHQGTRGRMRWEQMAFSTYDLEVFQVEPARSPAPATVVLRAGERLLGLAGDTGKPLWDAPNVAWPVVLFSTDSTQPVRIADSNNHFTVCRAFGARSTTAHLARAVRAARRYDPRQSRSLPWRNDGQVGPEMALTAVVALAALGIPGSILLAAIRRRSFSIVRLMAVPILLALAFVVLRSLGPMMMSGAFDPGRLSGPLMQHHPAATEAVRRPTDLIRLALQGLPLLVVVCVPIGRAIRGDWRGFRRVVALGLLVTAAYALTRFAFDARTIDPGQYYSSDGFAWVALFPAYFTGVALMLASVARGCASMLRRIRGSGTCGSVVVLPGSR